MTIITDARDVDRRNAEFWNELCGTTLAQALGIQDRSEASLGRFDAAYLDLYPYLLGHVQPEAMAGQRVLEVGLGYGTLGEQIARAGARYVGLDLAAGPVAMMNHRLDLQGLRGDAVRGSILDCPLQSASVDHVVAIGCFHHTGNVERAIDETWRVLKPGGSARLMLYNQFSYRQWGSWPGRTLRAFLAQRGLAPSAAAVTADQKRSYDADAAGRAAPETVFLSVRGLREMLRRFSRVEIQKENCSDLAIGVRIPLVGRSVSFGFVPRKTLLSTLGRRWGLDLYVKAWK